MRLTEREIYIVNTLALLNKKTYFDDDCVPDIFNLCEEGVVSISGYDETRGTIIELVDKRQFCKVKNNRYWNYK